MYEKYLEQLEESEKIRNLKERSINCYRILFPNKFAGNYLTVSTLEQVMRRAISDAGLPKKATPHCLRHSFATHLMEQEVERQNIQAPLGHRDPKSTEVYLHASLSGIT